MISSVPKYYFCAWEVIGHWYYRSDNDLITNELMN